jgi:predicted nucleic acid-binding protein
MMLLDTNVVMDAMNDFFIGAQGEIMGWKIATRDQERFKKYFPKVALVAP